MIALLPNIQPTFDFLNTGEVSNLGSAIATSLLIKKIFRNTSENEFWSNRILVWKLNSEDLTTNKNF